MKSLTTIDKITDVEKRAKAACAVVREARAKADEPRNLRDLAALILIDPFARAVARSNQMRADAVDAYKGYWTVDGARYTTRRQVDQALARNSEAPAVWVAPTIDAAEYAKRLAASRAQRDRDLAAADVTVFPSDVYSTLDVSRALLVRMMARLPAVLPTLDDEPMKVAKRAARQAAKYDAHYREVLAYRDALLHDMLNGTGDSPRVYSNAEIARLTGLTTARIAQLRTGKR